MKTTVVRALLLLFYTLFFISIETGFSTDSIKFYYYWNFAAYEFLLFDSY